MLQPIINKVSDLERKIKEVPLTEANVREVRISIVSILHDLVTALSSINMKLEAEVLNGKFIIVKETIYEGLKGILTSEEDK